MSFEVLANSPPFAVQFDVNATGQPVSLLSPSFQGLSDHLVESRKLDSGAIRYLVYSRFGAPLSPDGRVGATLASPFEPENGMISISGVIATDAAGQSIPAQVNALPLRRTHGTSHLKGRVGVPMDLSTDAVDPDGTVANVAFVVGSEIVATAGGESQSATWTPANPGAYVFYVIATDDIGREAVLEAGTIGILGSNLITNYPEFAATHFGDGAPESVKGFDADPLGTGVPNGLAYLLGLDPNAVDLSQLPALLPVGDDGHAGASEAGLVLRFLIPSGIADTEWAIHQTTDLAEWTLFPSDHVSLSEISDEFTLVEASIPSELVSDRIFLRLKLNLAD